MNLLGLVVLGLSVITVDGSGSSKFKPPVPYILEEENNAVAGRVIYDAHRGSKVKAVVKNSQSGTHHESHDNEVEGPFLRVVRKLAKSMKPSRTPERFDIAGMTTKPTASRLTSEDVHPSEAAQPHPLLTNMPSNLVHIIHRRSRGTAFTSHHVSGHISGDNWHTMEGIIPHKTHARDRLPPDSKEPTLNNFVSEATQMARQAANDESVFQDVEDVKFEEDEVLVYKVMRTDLFFIDDEGFVVVANSSTFKDLESVNVVVYLSNERGAIRSTPLVFTIYIDKPVETSGEYPAVPALFAGVLVLCIVFLALFIPFVTRAKRRYKQGKPIFKMGSHPSKVDFDSKPVIPRVDTSEPNWYGNNTIFSYEEEVEKERSDFAAGIKRLSTKRPDPPTLQLHKKVKAKAPSSSSSSTSEAAASTQDDTKPIQPRKKKTFRDRFLSHP